MDEFHVKAMEHRAASIAKVAKSMEGTERGLQVASTAFLARRLLSNAVLLHKECKNLLHVAPVVPAKIGVTKQSPAAPPVQNTGEANQNKISDVGQGSRTKH